MANATVDKLKDLGLRHGEKAVVGLVAVLCLVFLWMAISTPTIEITPDDVKKATESARSNIGRNPTPEQVAEKLQQDEIKERDFLAIVAAREPGNKTAEPYRLATAFASPEPGAGLVREQPKLLAPERLIAHAGRGSTVVYATDDRGNRIYEEPTTKDATKKSSRRRNSGFSMGGMPGMESGGSSKGSTRDEEERKRQEQRKEARLRGSLAGTGGRSKEAEKPAEEESAAEEPRGTAKEVLAGIRWVSVVGELDHKALRENYARALKVPFESAHPNYLRLDMQRQLQQPDGTWPEEWEDVERRENERILNNIKMQEDELVPAEHRLDALVDMLPFLRAGYWRAVHVANLVPDEVKNPKKQEPIGGMMSRGGMGAGMSMGPGMSMGSGGAGYGEMMSRGSSGMGPGMSMGSGAGMSMSGGGMSMGGYPGMGMGGGGGGGGGIDTNFPKSDAETLMIRSLDFTVSPDAVYRYRLRVVVRNPNYRYDLVQAGTDTENEELAGPWSEPTAAVGVPADVTTYAIGRLPGAKDAPGAEQMDFRVVKWNPEDGITVYKQFSVAPGDIIGQVQSVALPSDDWTKTINKPLDLTSHQLVLDTMGGPRSLESLGLGPRFDSPARALVVRADGSLVLRDEARDTQNGEMEEMKDIYDTTLKEVSPSNQKGKAPSMMGGMMGGMSGGPTP